MLLLLLLLLLLLRLPGSFMGIRGFVEKRHSQFAVQEGPRLLAWSAPGELMAIPIPKGNYPNGPTAHLTSEEGRRPSLRGLYRGHSQICHGELAHRASLHISKL